MRVIAEEDLEQCTRETRIIEDTYCKTLHWPPKAPVPEKELIVPHIVHIARYRLLDAILEDHRLDNIRDGQAKKRRNHYDKT